MKQYSIDDLERLFRVLNKREWKLRFTEKGVEVETTLDTDPNAWSRFLSLNDFIARYYEKYPDDLYALYTMDIPVVGAERSNTGG
jgi:hypothetical protein